MMPIENVGPAEPLKPREVIAKMMRLGMTRKQAKHEYRRLKRLEWWGNDRYSVGVDRDSELHGFGPSVRCVHVSFHLRDRAPVSDWRECQEIKNAVLGAEAEAIMLYPAESRVIDTANEFHLWACFDRASGEPMTMPVGWRAGLKTSDSREGAVQRPHSSQLNGDQP
jgi:hypothetical protein